MGRCFRGDDDEIARDRSRLTLNYALSDLLIPPLGLAWLALFALAVGAARGRRSRLAVGGAAVAVVLLLVLAMPAVATRLLISLESGLPTQPPPGAPPQAIVILSGDSVRTTGGREVDDMTLERLLAGVRLYRHTGLPILVSGGRVANGESETYAALMTRVLEGDFRVPVRWQEARSQTTWSNAEDSAAILLPLGIRSVYVVTHAWHERRAVLAFRHFGMIPTAAPTFFEKPGSGGFVPTPTGFAHSFYALHEWLGLLEYRLRARFSQRQAPEPGPPKRAA